MTREEILKIVNNIFKDVFSDDSLVINESTSALDIEEWDSLTHISLINNIEDLFKMTFTLEEVMEMKNVGEMLSIIEERIK